jgi:hypothetical protein
VAETGQASRLSDPQVHHNLDVPGRGWTAVDVPGGLAPRAGAKKGRFCADLRGFCGVDFGRYPCRYACVAPVPDGSSNQRQRYPPTRACARADENAVSLQFDSVGG